MLHWYQEIDKEIGGSYMLLREYLEEYTKEELLDQARRL